MNARVIALACLLVLSIGCGGSGGGAAGEEPPPLPAGATLETDHARLVLDADGRVGSLGLLDADAEATTGDPAPLLELDRGGATSTSTSCRRDGDELEFGFDLGDRVRLRIVSRPGHLVFRVVEVAPVGADELRLRLHLRNLKRADSPLNGTFDDDTILCLRSVNANGENVFSPAGKVLDLTVRWVRRHGIVGGAAALLVAPRASFFDAMEALETAEGLPSPRLRGERARESAAVRESYLFLTAYAPGDLDTVIEAARLGGFGAVLLQRDIWRETSGTYGIDEANFPGGLEDFAAACDRIHAAGLDVGLHLYGPAISPNDPLVTPAPAEGLLAFECPPLAAAADAAATTLLLEAAPDLPSAGGGGWPGRLLRIGDEIVRYAGTEAGPPFAFTGCERGALGTTAAAHAAGAAVDHLATLWDMLLVDPDGPLVSTLATNLARVVDGAGVDFLYFDGTALIPTGEPGDRWYVMNRILPAYDAAFGHPVLMQTAMGPGRQLAWHLVPRSASADGHGDIKAYLDARAASIESIRRGFTTPDVGWYGLDEGRPPDHLEYIAAHCLGWDCPLSMQTHRAELEAGARARETLEALAAYERCRREGGLSEAARADLLEAGADWRLLEDDAGAWRLFRAEYDRDENVRTLEGGDRHSWSLTVPGTAETTIGVEIVRGAAIRVDAPFDVPGAIAIDDFEDAAPWAPGGTNDFARLVNRVEPVVSGAGVGRVGMEFSFGLTDDAESGAAAAEITARNDGRGLGWCAVGRRFESPVDLGASEAIGLWLRGDASSTVLRIELYDDDGDRVVLPAPAHHEGWRLETFALNPPAAFDRSRVRYLVLILTDLPPGGEAVLAIDSLRALPTVNPARDLEGVAIRVGERLVDLPAALPPGGTARIDALGRLTIRPGGLAEGRTWTLAGGPIRLGPGTSEVRFEIDDPTDDAGDVSVRTSRLTERETDSD